MPEPVIVFNAELLIAVPEVCNSYWCDIEAVHAYSVLRNTARITGEKIAFKGNKLQPIDTDPWICYRLKVHSQ